MFYHKRWEVDMLNSREFMIHVLLYFSKLIIHMNLDLKKFLVRLLTRVKHLKKLIFQREFTETL